MLGPSEWRNVTTICILDMKESGVVIRHTGLGSTSVRMSPTKAIGFRISSMARELKLGNPETVMKVNSQWGKNKD
jgi:hypothetical protein